jgi:thioester reductase-like protein
VWHVKKNFTAESAEHKSKFVPNVTGYGDSRWIAEKLLRRL